MQIPCFLEFLTCFPRIENKYIKGHSCISLLLVWLQAAHSSNNRTFITKHHVHPKTAHLSQNSRFILKRHIYPKIAHLSKNSTFKVNSTQEACAKCFVIHILEFEILQITWNKWNKEHQTLKVQFFTNRFSILISNFNKWTVKHLAQASCTELTL